MLARGSYIYIYVFFFSAWVRLCSRLDECEIVHSFHFLHISRKKVLHFCLFSFFFCLLVCPSNQMSDNSLHTKNLFLFGCLGDEKKGRKKISNCLKIFVCVCENLSSFLFFWFVSSSLIVGYYLVFIFKEKNTRKWWNYYYFFSLFFFL